MVVSSFLHFRTLSVFIFILSYEVIYSDRNIYNRHPRIAIIGGGVGGTTAAFELSQKAMDYGFDFEIDLYEPGNIGGRTATELFNGYEFETGASIIHKENKYLSDYADKFNLTKVFKSKSKSKSKSSDKFGFWNGDEFVLVQSYFDVFTFAKLWWRYGFDLITIQRHFVEPVMTQFGRIYEIQANETTFDNLRDFLKRLDPDFVELLTRSLGQFLMSQGFGERFVQEFIFIATNVNYNQDIGIHAFVGAVALAGADDSDSLWSVQGGNKLIPQALLKHSDAKLIKEKVQSVVYTSDNRYALYVDDVAHLYDYVIVACPIMANSFERGIRFEDFPNAREELGEEITTPITYQKTIATLVHGKLNCTYFGYSSSNDCPNSIFSVNDDLFFNSISILDPVTDDENYDEEVFKVFSKEVLTEEQVDSLFSSYDELTSIEWLAYPVYDNRYKNMTFVLEQNLFYVNGIEWAASAMEMSAISGVNAALHVFKKMKIQNRENLYPEELGSFEKPVDNQN